MPVKRILASLVVVAIPVCAAAQDQEKTSDANTASTGQAQGPMTIERVHNGWAVAPDFKVTRIDGATGRLAGAYGGWVFDNTLLVGGGGYWMTNGAHDRDLSYGGAVVEWLQRADRAIGYSVRGLAGFGTSRLAGTIDGYAQPLRRFDRDGRTLASATRQAVFRDHFFVFEPQANALVRLTRLLRLDAGVGYRLIDGGDRVDRRLRGISGSVALQIGGVSSNRE